MKNKKLTPEERADEIIDRFSSILFGGPIDDIILCSLELVKEAIFISSKDYNAEWSNRKYYWENVKIALEERLKYYTEEIQETVTV